MTPKPKELTPAEVADELDDLAGLIGVIENPVIEDSLHVYAFRDEDVATLRRAAELLRGIPMCSHCGKPASCYGVYENHLAMACDLCCGHGCEDGECKPLYAGKAVS